MLQSGRRRGLMVSALDSGACGLGSSPDRGHCVVFLDKTLLSRCLSPPRCRNGTGNDSNNDNDNNNKNKLFVGAFTAPFNNMRTLKFEAQPTNGFFAAVNQVFGGSS